MAISIRAVAAHTLAEFHRRDGYSNAVLDELLGRDTFLMMDRALLSRLFYGVIERRMTLDFLLSECSSTPIKKMHPLVRETLRVAVYQLVYMDRIPPSAAVNEAVTAVRQLKQAHAAGFVNGVLRAVTRKKDELLAQLPETDEGLSVRYSCPIEWIEFWREAYGDTRMREILTSINEEAPEYVRFNTLLGDEKMWCETLEDLGITYEKVPYLPSAFRLKCAYLLNQLESEQKNWYYYQDIASQWAIVALDPQPDERVADVCAAPGGKSFTAAQTMGDRGEILSCDVYAHKCETMAERAKQYGISVMHTRVRDASEPCAPEHRAAFDRVLCDVPCSGLGVIRRKPEIRYRSVASIADLPSLQYTILEKSAEMVRPGGVLQYSTCTLNPAENERVVERFLREHPEFSRRLLPIPSVFEALGIPQSHMVTLFPSVHGSDGFFLAGFVKNEV